MRRGGRAKEREEDAQRSQPTMQDDEGRLTDYEYHNLRERSFATPENPRLQEVYDNRTGRWRLRRAPAEFADEKDRGGRAEGREEEEGEA